MPPRSFNDWQRLDTLLNEALKRPEDERTAFLRATCGQESALYEEAIALLASMAEAERALGESVEQYAAPLLDPEAPLALATGTRVGAYRVVEEIGRGGMGVVMRAERADGAFARQVALKLVKRGMDTDEVLRRFRSERQILAGLDHPGIARLLDAGAADDGRPFLAMEYVDGERITTYATRHQLDVAERVRLFEQVCEAVRYAHSRLVVHRDLKPSNILVSQREDRAPCVKLLDFGIARLLDPAVDGVLTQTGHRRLTPEYAAPEQRHGEAITTATDVYALGVVLFELLTGERPPAPDALPSAAVDDESMRRRLRGDLDTIVGTALQEDMEDRYPSVEALLDDLRRHLGHVPIQARPASRTHRARKFVQRHRAGVGAALLVLAALLVGLGMTAWQARETAREAARADRARDFALSLFDLADPNEARGQAVTAEDLLDQGAERALTELREEPEVQEQILLELAGINHRLSRYGPAREQLETVRAQRTARLGAEDPGVAVAVSGLASLAVAEGHLEEADSLFQIALAVQRTQSAPLELARTLHSFGALARSQNDNDAAEARQREALTLRQRHADPRSPEVAESLKSLALVQHQRGETDDAEALYRHALALQVELTGEVHPEVGRICNSLASLLRARGRYTEAGRLYQRALTVYRQVYPDGGRAVVSALAHWGSLLIERGQPEAAQAPANEAVRMATRLFGDRHSTVALAKNTLALALAEQGDTPEAIALQTDVVALYEGGLGPDHPTTAIVRTSLARFHLDYGDVAAANALFQQAWAVQEVALEPGHTNRVRALLGRGRVALTQGQPDAAEPLLREALDIRQLELGADHPHTAEAQSWLGACLTAQGRLDEAAPLIEASARYERGEARRSIQRAIRGNLATYRAQRSRS